MKVTYSLALVVAVVALMGSSTPLRASETDDRIESTFKKTYVYKTYLKDEHIKISSKDGAVTLSGYVDNETHKPMAQDTAGRCPGSRPWIIASKSKATNPRRVRIRGSA